MINKSTHKIIFLLMFFCSFLGKATDSLKVKKLDYMEDGRLFRTTYYDTSGNITKDFFFNYYDIATGGRSNGCDIYKYENNKRVAFTKYFFKMGDNNVFFYEGPLIGYRWNTKYDSLNRITENECEVIYLLNYYSNRTGSIDSLESFPIKVEVRYQSRRFYDTSGNLIEEKYIDNPKIIHKTLYKYDIQGRRIEKFVIDDKQRVISTYAYFKEYLKIDMEIFNGKRMHSYNIWKFFENEQKQEIKVEKYEVKVKKSKPMGEPKVVFTEEKIYENNRIVKIKYTDHITNKTNIYELKYEFYD